MLTPDPILTSRYGRGLRRLTLMMLTPRPDIDEKVRKEELRRLTLMMLTPDPILDEKVRKED